jgi:hypothetical protein
MPSRSLPTDILRKVLQNSMLHSLPNVSLAPWFTLYTVNYISRDALSHLLTHLVCVYDRLGLFAQPLCRSLQ